MRLLLVSDLHCDAEAARAVVARAKDFDVVVGAGDFATARRGLGGATVGGRAFFGIGGGIPVTPFGKWSYDFSEVEADRLLRSCPPGCVLVSHSPPKGCVDVASNGASLGSTAIRAAIERVRPVLVVCGHIHASAGRHEMIGATPVVNAGPVGVEWELAEHS